MRPRQLLAASLLLLILLAAVPLSLPASSPPPQLSAASTDLSVLRAYGANVSSLNATLSRALQLYAEGNYTGAEELSLRVMEASYLYLRAQSPRPAPWAEAAGYLAVLEYLASSLRFNSTYSSTLESYAAKAYALLSQGNYSGSLGVSLRGLGLVSGYSAAMSSSGLSEGLAQLLSLAQRDVLELNATASGEARANMYSDVEELYLLVSGANVTSPGQLVELYSLLALINRSAQQLQPLLNMSFRERVAAQVSANLSLAEGLLARAANETSALNSTYAVIMKELSNASSALSCLQGALEEEYLLREPGNCSAPSLRPGQLEGNISRALADVIAVAQRLPGVNVSLGLQAAYENLSQAMGYLNQTDLLVEQALGRMSTGAPSRLSNASLSSALKLISYVNASPQGPYVRSATASLESLASALGELVAVVNGSGANLSLSASIARASRAQASELAMLDYEALGNTSLAITAYIGGNDGLTIEYSSASQQLAEEALQDATTYYIYVSAPVRELLGNVSAAIASLDGYINYAVNQYPTPPSKYVPYLKEAANATMLLSMSLLMDAEAFNVTGPQAGGALANATGYLWEAAPYAVGLKDLVYSNDPSLAQQLSQAVADLGELSYAAWSSLLLGEALGQAYLGNYTGALILANASAAKAAGIGNYSAAVRGTPNLPWLNVTLLAASRDVEAIVNVSAPLQGLQAEALEQVSQVGSWASQASADWRALSETLYLDSEAAGYAAEGNYSEAEAYASRAEALAQGVTGGGPVELVSSLAPLVSNLSGSLMMASLRMGELYSEAQEDAAAGGASLQAYAYLGQAVGLLERAEAELLEGGQGSAYALGAYNYSLRAMEVASEAGGEVTAFEAPAKLIAWAALALEGAFVEVNVTQLNVTVISCAGVNGTAYLVAFRAGGGLYLGLSPRPLEGSVEVRVEGRLSIIYLVAPES